MQKINKAWSWLKALWSMNSNITKILENQDKIKDRLDNIEQAIKSPQYQVAELEKIQKTIELLKENNEQEIKKLKMGSQEEIAQHKTKITELTNQITELNKYKNIVADAVEVIGQKNLTIKQLNEELNKLKQKAPASLWEAFSAGYVNTSLSDALAKSLFESNTILGKK